jgi:hypothetical protein
MVTQYASSTKMSVVEKIGLLKMDFLGLKNLTIMQNAIRIIRALGKFPGLAEKLGIFRKTPLRPTFSTASRSTIRTRIAFSRKQRQPVSFSWNQTA